MCTRGGSFYHNRVNVQLLQIIPQQFVQLFRDLVSECRVFERSSSDDDTTATTLIDRLERMLTGGLQLLQDSAFVTEYSIVRGMRRELSLHIHLILHGVNDSTAPPISILPIHVQWSGRRGRPRIVVNVDLVELLRGCGYTWNEIADAMQIGRATIWRRLKEAGVSVQKYSDIIEDELDANSAGISKLWSTANSRVFEGQGSARTMTQASGQCEKNR